MARGSRAQQPPAAAAAKFAQWGDETLAAIDRDFWLADQKLYAEKANLGQRPTQPAFTWGASVQLSALAAAARFNPAKYQKPLTDYADQLQSYWVQSGGIGGYDVLPVRSSVDRYYDDNAWMALALLETSDLTGERKYLDRAASTLRFVLSGEDDSLGGGIYWRENPRRTKNTCANAPAVVAALRLFQATHDQRHLADAERLYAWVKSNLQDPADGLYWDNIRPSGHVDRRKFSYNAALMVRANCLFYVVKHNSKSLAEAERIAQSAASHWIDPKSGAVRDAGRFAHMLLEALLAFDQLSDRPRWQTTVCRSLEYVHQYVRDPNGHYPASWHDARTSALAEFQLIDQASAARAYFAAANALRQPPSPAQHTPETNDAHERGKIRHEP